MRFKGTNAMNIDSRYKTRKNLTEGLKIGGLRVRCNK